MFITQLLDRPSSMMWAAIQKKKKQNKTKQNKTKQKQKKTKKKHNACSHASSEWNVHAFSTMDEMRKDKFAKDLVVKGQKNKQDKVLKDKK